MLPDLRAQLRDTELDIVDRDGAVLRRIGIDEASALRDDLTAALTTYRRRNPPTLPDNAGGYRIGGPPNRRWDEPAEEARIEWKTEQLLREWGEERSRR